MTRKAVITVKEIDALKDQGMTQSDIARQFGVTRSYISWIKTTYGGKRTPREIALDTWPWEVQGDHTNTSPYQRLRDHVEYMATNGKDMGEGKLERLRAWYEQVENVVVEYDPEYPPTPGIKYGGFRYTPREDSDGEMLIRIPDEDMTPKIQALYRRPTVLP